MPRPKNPNAKRDIFNIRLTREQKQKLEKYAKENGITMTEAIERFIEGLDVRDI